VHVCDLLSTEQKSILILFCLFIAIDNFGLLP